MGLLSRVTGPSARIIKNHHLLSKCSSLNILSRRTYLSDAYKCDKEWRERRKDPLLTNVDVEQFFVDLTRKFAAKTKSSFAVDVDIFVNSIEKEDALHELDNALHRLRRSRHTVDTLPSTGAAATRFLISHDLGDDLMRMLQDRYNYGIFLDTYTTNILMDTFLKQGNNRDAAKVAIELMLQEDPGNEISRCLALLSCTKYLSDPKPTPWKQEAAVEEEDDDEIEYVRVPNLTNPFFDDHFDLTESDAQIGKTMVFFAKCSPKGVIRDTALVVGLARREKWNELKALIDEKTELSADVSDLCFRRPVVVAESGEATEAEGEASEKPAEGNVEEPVKEARPDWVEKAIAKSKKSSETLVSLLENEAKNLGKYEAEDIAAQKQMFKQWQELRHKAIADQEQAADRERRIEAIRQKKKELGEKEELLYVFENWNKIEMLLAEVEKEEANKEVAQQEYVPPTVGRKHRALQ